MLYMVNSYSKSRASNNALNNALDFGCKYGKTTQSALAAWDTRIPSPRSFPTLFRLGNLTLFVDSHRCDRPERDIGTRLSVRPWCGASLVTSSKVIDWRAGWARGGVVLVVVFAFVWTGFLVMISILLSAREVPPTLCRRPPPRVRFLWPGTGGRRERRAFARDQSHAQLALASEHGEDPPFRGGRRPA